MVKARCFKDKKQIEMQNPEYSVTKRGTVQVRGTCPICGGKVFTFVSADKAPAEIRAKLHKRGSSRHSRK